MMPEPAILLPLMRAGHGPTLRSVLRVLQRHGGDVQATAGALGISPDVLYLTARRHPAWGEQFAALRQGKAALGNIARRRAQERQKRTARAAK